MKLAIKPDKYVVAVSGGVDSVVLLDYLNKIPDLDLVVAHFDHGMRLNSKKDRLFVQSLAKKHDLPFEYGEEGLGKNASEALAREKRYQFLHKIREERGAAAVITAHHQDDLLETAIINLMRGTNRRGLSSLGETADIKRPLLGYPKNRIVTYAKEHKLAWHEDSTNTDTKYLRNHIRHNVLPRFGATDRQKLLDLINQTGQLNQKIDKLLDEQLSQYTNDKELDRYYFIILPHKVSLEVMAAWLRSHGVMSYSSKTLNRLTVSIKTSRPGAKFDILKNSYIFVGQDYLALCSLER